MPKEIKLIILSPNHLENSLPKKEPARLIPAKDIITANKEKEKLPKVSRVCKISYVLLIV